MTDRKRDAASIGRHHGHDRQRPRREAGGSIKETTRDRSATTAVVALGAMALALAGAHAVHMSGDARADEIRAAVADEGEDCRPAYRRRLHARMDAKSAPLTRRDVERIADGLRDCAEQADQIRAIDAPAPPAG